jgi:hypothetical protein
MVPSESAQELSNEWSLSVGFANYRFFGQFLCPALSDRSRHQSLKSRAKHASALNGGSIISML